MAPKLAAHPSLSCSRQESAARDTPRAVQRPMADNLPGQGLDYAETVEKLKGFITDFDGDDGEQKYMK
eukprot:4812416-Prymnesium_polylepis.1